MSPIRFSEIYDAIFFVFESIEKLFKYLNMPLRQLIDVALEGGLLGEGFFGDIVDWILDNIITENTANLSLIQLLFGSGLALILVLLLVKFFLGVARG